ncbi:MAG TPA: sugar phosphate nucleotidyltransferase [Chloroflexota bacterium]
MKAVVMAGGEGSRLRPLTLGRPKPMVPLVNRPMLEHILLLLKRHGITDVILTVQYMANYIQNQIGDGSDFGMSVTYSVEEHPLGTAGSVRQAEEFLKDTFLVISGDALTDFDLSAVIAFHQKCRAMATLTLYRVANPLEYGVVVTGEGGRIQQFQEKPSWSDVVTDTINTGIYVLEPSIFEYYSRDQVFDFSKDLFPMLLKDEKPLYGYIAEGYWTDVGSLEEYVRASRDVLGGKVQIEWSGELANGIWRESGAKVDGSAQIHGSVYLGRDVRVMGGAVIDGPVVIGDNTVVERRAHLDRSIIWRNCRVGQQAEMRGCLLADECNVRANASIFENAVVADQTTIGRGAIIHPNVKIWPHKEVDAGAELSTSLIWGAAGRRVLFGRFGVSGLINTDFIPEMLAKLGSAYASTLPIGSSITLNRDLAVSSRMLKRAIGSGPPSAGVNMLDLSAVPIAVARFSTATSEALGGIHVGVASEDRTIAHLLFFDRNGMDIDKGTQRKIESTFFREDVRRVHVDDVGEMTYMSNVVERYTEAFLQAVDHEAIEHAGFRLVVEYSMGTTSLILPALLRSLGCRLIDLNANQGLTRAPRSFLEYTAAFEQLSSIVSTVKYNLGAMLDFNGERLYLVDGVGERIPSMHALAAIASLVFQQTPGATVAVTADAPNVFEDLARQHGGKVIRTALDPHGPMTVARQKGVALAGDGNGAIIFPHFFPFFDGMFSLARLLELLSHTHSSFQEVVAALPAWHQAETDVTCPWEKKGRVMRLLGEQYRDRRVRSPDGIKIQLEDDWVLILPDPDEPQFRLVVEAQSDKKARALVDTYVEIVADLQR